MLLDMRILYQTKIVNEIRRNINFFVFNDIIRYNRNKGEYRSRVYDYIN